MARAYVVGGQIEAQRHPRCRIRVPTDSADVASGAPRSSGDRCAEGASVPCTHARVVPCSVVLARCRVHARCKFELRASRCKICTADTRRCAPHRPQSDSGLRTNPETRRTATTPQTAVTAAFAWDTNRRARDTNRRAALGDMLRRTFPTCR